MSNLPVIAAIEELQDSNTDNRQRLQKSMRAGMLNIVRSVQSLENSFTNFSKAFLDEQQKQAFLQLEAQREAARKQQEQIDKKTEDMKAGKIDVGFMTLSGLTAIAASITGFDDWLMSLQIPRILKNMRNAFTTIADKVKSAKNAVFAAGVKIANIEWGKLVPTIRFPEGDTFSAKALGVLENVKNSLMKPIRATLSSIRKTFPVAEWAETVGDVLTKAKTGITSALDSVKTGVVNNFSKIKVPDFPTLAWPDAVKNLKLPTIEAPKIFTEFKFPEMPETGKVLDNVKAFFVGTDAGGGVLGFFGKIGDLLTSIPGLKTAFRLVGGPVTAALLSIIDFFTGFYKGFVGEVGSDEMDPRNERELLGKKTETERTLSEKIFAGIEEGFLSFVEGITGAFDFLFIEIPAWLLGKFGMENASEWLKSFSLTEMVRPIWDGIKNVFKFFSNAEYRAEQVTAFKSKVSDTFNDMWETIKGWIGGIFDFLPSMDDITQKLNDLMPDWLKVETTTGTTVAQTGVTEDDLKAQAAELGLMQMPLVSLADTPDAQLSSDQLQAKFRAAEMARQSREAIAAENAARTQDVSEKSATQSSSSATVVVVDNKTDASQTSIQKVDTTIAVPPKPEPNNGWANMSQADFMRMAGG